MGDPDPDIGTTWPFLKDRNPEDDLTDSDSEEEEEEEEERATLPKKPMEIVNNLCNIDSTQKGEDKAAEAPDNLVDTSVNSNIGVVNSSEIDVTKKNQVELLRDRKVIELEKTMREEKTSKFEAYYHELQLLADSTGCPLDKVEIQKPF